MISEFLTEENWLKNMTSADIDGKPIQYYKYAAEKFDITSALKLHYKGDAYDEAVSKFKAAFNAVFPEKYKSCKVTYRDASGESRTVYPLYLMNDSLSFKELRRLFSITDI